MHSGSGPPRSCLLHFARVHHAYFHNVHGAWTRNAMHEVSSAAAHVKEVRRSLNTTSETDLKSATRSQKLFGVHRPPQQNQDHQKTQL